jgi:bifunctional DNA-binding transcriptional regulator/antitoxin component of YhaV-PrlF toxin-antitoxin module
MANITTVGVAKNGQRLTTVPRAIAEAMRLEKGSKIEWIFDRGDVVVRKF